MLLRLSIITNIVHVATQTHIVVLPFNGWLPWLCELQKALRVVEGLGKPTSNTRRLYH